MFVLYSLDDSLADTIEFLLCLEPRGLGDL